MRFITLFLPACYSLDKRKMKVASCRTVTLTNFLTSSLNSLIHEFALWWNKLSENDLAPSGFYLYWYKINEMYYFLFFCTLSLRPSPSEGARENKMIYLHFLAPQFYTYFRSNCGRKEEKKQFETRSRNHCYKNNLAVNDLLTNCACCFCITRGVYFTFTVGGPLSGALSDADKNLVLGIALML